MKGFAYVFITLILSHQIFGGKINKKILINLAAHDDAMQSSVQANMDGIESNGEKLVAVGQKLEKISSENAAIVNDAVNAINETIILNAYDIKTDIQANLDTIQDLADQVDSHDNAMKLRIDENHLEIEANGDALSTIDSEVQENQAVIEANNDKLTALEDEMGKLLAEMDMLQENLATHNESVITLLTQTTPPGPGPRNCTDGYEDRAATIFGANDKCYYHYNNNTRINYDDAIAKCKEIFGSNAILAEPRNQTELDNINDGVANMGWFLWIGINDRGTEGNWVYETSLTPVGFTAWDSGQPSTAADADCVAIQPDTGLWLALACTGTRHALCEF